jgi:DNA-binding transcriptional ArsR family regulator
VRRLRVDVDAGEGYDLLMSAVAVADPDWCAVLSHGDAVRRAVQGAGGSRLVRDGMRLGRFGWINLAGLLADARGGASRDELLDLVRRTDAVELHAVIVGARRSRLTDHVPAETVRAAVAGDRSAWQQIRRTVRPPEVLLEVAPWLQRAPSREVREVVLRTIQSWPAVGDTSSRRAALARARSIRRQDGAEGLLRWVTAGIRYGPADLERVLLIPSELVAPIIIWVDEAERTLIVHPPLGDSGVSDAGTVLAAAGAAVGDETRIRLLRELRSGSRTLPDLCTALDRPRTTLLHHLALLRSAGLVTLTVSAGEPNVYAVDRRGFESLARAAKGFLIG